MTSDGTSGSFASNQSDGRDGTGERTPNVFCFRRAWLFFALGGWADRASAVPDRVRVGAVKNTWSEQPSEIHTVPLCVVILVARGVYALFLLGCWRIVGLLYDSMPKAPQIRGIASSC